MLLTGKRTLLLILSLTLMLAASPGAFAAGGENPCGGNPCATNPCATKNPCATNPCAANPCAMKNPCAAKQAAEAVIPIRKWPLKNYNSVVKKGARLWNDTRLGTSGISCASCHPNGALLTSKPWPKHVKMTMDIVTLDQMINFCMMNPMKAKPLAWNSQKLTALAAYVTEQTAKSGANPCSMLNPCAMLNPCGD